MENIGAQASVSVGVTNAAIRVAESVAIAFALFTKNQRQWHATPLTAEVTDDQYGAEVCIETCHAFGNHYEGITLIRKMTVLDISAEVIARLKAQQTKEAVDQHER